MEWNDEWGYASFDDPGIISLVPEIHLKIRKQTLYSFDISIQCRQTSKTVRSILSEATRPKECLSELLHRHYIRHFTNIRN